MKINLNAEVEDLVSALNAGLLVVQQNPTQRVNTAATVSQQGVLFEVTKNEDSWTVEYA